MGKVHFIKLTFVVSCARRVDNLIIISIEKGTFVFLDNLTN